MAKKKSIPKLKADDVCRALETHYGDSAVVVFEVPDATGFAGKGRRMDAVAVGCWPSRGMYLHAIEVKVSRSDFLKEIGDPAKAEAIAQYCDCMYVAAPKGMVDAAELPPKWGLYEVSESGSVRQAVTAKKLKIKKIDRGFNAALIRAAVQQKSEAKKIQKLEALARSEAWQSAKDHYESNQEKLNEEIRKLTAELTQWRSYGYTYRSLTPQHVGKLLKSLASLRGDYGALNELRSRAETIREQTEQIEKVAKLLFDPDEETDA